MRILYTIFSLQLKQGNFLSQGCQDKWIWRRKQTKVTVFFTMSAFLLVSTFVEAILTTSTSACQPSCGSQLLWKPHQPLLWALLRHLHMLRHSSVDWLVGWSTSSSTPSRFSCCVLLALSWNTNENPSRNKLSWAIIKISAITDNYVNKTLFPRESQQSSPGMKIS